MKDDHKSKSQLIDELEATRRELETLKQKVGESKEEESVIRSPRKEIDADIEFIMDIDIISAKGVNLSEGGICFEMGDDLPFEMQFEVNGKLHRHRAHLIWIKRFPHGGYRFGLKFIDEERPPVF